MQLNNLDKNLIKKVLNSGKAIVFLYYNHMALF